MDLNDQAIGWETSVVLQTNDQFTRINEFTYDFNLNGENTFVGRVLDIGQRGSTYENYYSYIDESDAATEDCDNGGGRYFDDLDFTSRTHPTDLAGIDTVQYVTKTIAQTNDLINISAETTQYDVTGFDYQDLDSNSKNYGRHDEFTNEGL
ncbi:hypothetical protein JCM19241_1137 [Vibrio ishigakensis]|uniref:Uncharacterized protein n=1 Tax=Vibrio ishigakensis TaxID=1481914 RepID=A0A0B8QJR3_9VIBR|nr:hypothetical protein JCM19241_1137 [Vibrio ishigakensis]